MPFLSTLFGGLVGIIPSLVGRVLLALGFGYATFTGTTILIDSIVNGIKSNMQSLGSEVVQFLAWIWLDKALAMVFSAWVASMAIKTLGGNVIKKLIVK